MKKKKIWKIINESLEKLDCKRRPKISFFKKLYLSEDVGKYSNAYYTSFSGSSGIIRFYYPFFNMSKKYQIYAVQYSTCSFFEFLINGPQTVEDKYIVIEKLMKRLTSFELPRSMDISIYGLKDSFYDTLRTPKSSVIDFANYAAIVKDIHRVKK